MISVIEKWEYSNGTIILSPCCQCTYNWLHREQKFFLRLHSPHISKAEFPSDLAVVMDSRDQYAISKYFPHPECRRHPNQFGEIKNLPVASDLGPIVWESCRAPTVRGAPHVGYAKAHNPLIAPSAFTFGRGVSFQSALAERKACIEGIERMALRMPPRGETRYGMPDELDLEYVTFDNQPVAPCWWAAADTPENGRRVYVPLKSVQLGARQPNNCPIVIDSTGAALHYDKETCLSSALLEVIERSTLAASLCDDDWTLILDETLPDDVRHVLKFVESHEMCTRVFYAKGLASMSCCYAFAVSRADEVLIGAAAAEESVDAVRKAVHELYACTVTENEFSTELSRQSMPLKHLAELILLDRLRQPFIECCSKLDLSLFPGKLAFVDRGNGLTDALGLHAFQCVAPHLWPPQRALPTGIDWPMHC